jgi:hypothetical protein
VPAACGKARSASSVASFQRGVPLSAGFLVACESGRARGGRRGDKGKAVGEPCGRQIAGQNARTNLRHGDSLAWFAEARATGAENGIYQERNR